MRIDQNPVLVFERPNHGFRHFIDHLGRVFKRIVSPMKADIHAVAEPSFDRKNWSFVDSKGNRAPLSVKILTPEEQKCPKLLRLIEVAFNKLLGRKETPEMETMELLDTEAIKEGDLLRYNLGTRNLYLKINGNQFRKTITSSYVINSIAPKSGPNQTRV